MDIIKNAKENNYFSDIIAYITAEWANILEYNENNKLWCYLRRDTSGRDFFYPIPLNYITEDEKERLSELVIEDCDIEDYEWEIADIDEVKELLYEEEFIDIIIDHLTE